MSGIDQKRAVTPMLQMRGITKSYPGVKALRDGCIDLYPGEVHALIGENGAGKSTLMKILSGNILPDEGEILLDGHPVRIASPHAGQRLGIAMIHQEMMLAENVTVAQNMFMGREIIKNPIAGILDKNTMNRKADEILNGNLKAGVKVTALVESLSVAQKQLVEIARALLAEARIIIMDEPTSALTTNDITILFGIIRQLRQNGTAIIYITHRMEEIVDIADNVTVMRDGEHIETLPMLGTDIDHLIRLMVGRSLDDKYPRRDIVPSDEVALKVVGLSRHNVLKKISFELHRKEVLGIFGLIGAGRTELARAIFGADRIDSGEILVYGKKASIHSPGDAIRYGIGLVPEDRKLDGFVGIQSIASNITMPIIGSVRKWIFVDRQRQNIIADEYIRMLSIKTSSRDKAVRYLSGGNQQKVVIAKWLASRSEIIIFDEPTRGIDVGAKTEVYRIMNDLLAQGKSIIMISSEMPELLGVSDRILVMRGGEIVAECNTATTSCEVIIKCAL